MPLLEEEEEEEDDNAGGGGGGGRRRTDTLKLTQARNNTSPTDAEFGTSCASVGVCKRQPRRLEGVMIGAPALRFAWCRATTIVDVTDSRDRLTSNARDRPAHATHARRHRRARRRPSRIAARAP